MALADRLGSDRAGAQAVLVQIRLERPPDEQGGELERLSLLRSVDDARHGAGTVSRVRSATLSLR